MLFTDTLGDVNGVARFIRNAAAFSHGSGAELLVVTSTNIEIPHAPNIRNFAPLAAWPMPKYPTLEIVWPPRDTILRAAREFRPDVIHVSTPGSVGLIGRGAAGRMGVPLVGVYHTDFPAYVERIFGHESLSGLTTRAMRWFYRPFDVVLARSKAYAASLGWLGARRLETFRPGIVLEDFAATHRDNATLEALGSDPGAVRAVFVGRVSVEKNTPLLERAWLLARPALRAMGVNAELVIIGDGPDLARLRATLAHQGVVFAGFRNGSDLARLYASCDVLAFPSITDTLGQVVLEAQASGLPVLVTNVGGPSEVMRHGVSGLVLPSDERAWAASLVEMLSNHAKRREMAAAARATAREFAFGHSFQAWWDVHEGVMRGRGGSLG